MTSEMLESQKVGDPDALLSLLANEQRRTVLRSLARIDEEALEVNTLVDHVSERVRNGTPSDEDHRRRIHIALHQIHLPKLQASGVITYDPETKRIRNVDGEFNRELLTVVERVSRLETGPTEIDADHEPGPE